MATIYGSTMQSTWKTYLTYTVTETPTEYTIAVTDVGIKLAGTTYWITFCDKDAKWTFKLGAKSCSGSCYFGDIKKSESWRDEVFDDYNYSNISDRIVIDKTDSQQSISASFTINFPKWTRMKGNSGTDYGSTTSTASLALTIPALEKPKVSLTAIRDTDIETKVSVMAQVASFVGDEISEVVIDADGTSNTFSGGTIGSDGAIMIRTVIEDISIGQVIVTVKAIGRGGLSDTYSYKIPSAFYTMDIGGKGKEIAFGCPAIDENLPDEGLFKCAMENVFEKDIKTEGNVYAKGQLLASINKLKKILSNSYQETISITNGTFTSTNTTVVLVGNSLRVYMNGTANAAKTAGNIANETMMTIKFKDDKISGLYGISTAGASNGPNSQIQFGVSKSDDYYVITVTLAAIGQAISKGGSVNAYVALPVLLNLDAY